MPAIEPRPKQNFEYVQEKERSYESHHEHSGTERAQSVNVGRQISSSQGNQCGHPGALQRKCERYQNNGCAGLSSKDHRPEARISPEILVNRDICTLARRIFLQNERQEKHNDGRNTKHPIGVDIR